MLVNDAEVSAEARTNEKEKVERSWEKTDKTGSTDVVLRKLTQILTFFFRLTRLSTSGCMGQRCWIGLF